MHRIDNWALWLMAEGADGGAEQDDWVAQMVDGALARCGGW